jgi:hypothetical protein
MADAKEDPRFFHRLIWNTEEAVADLDYLTPAQKESILAVQPEDLIVGLACNPAKAVIIAADAFEEIAGVCGASCGASCGGSCAATCAGSCAGSCGGSCESSCGATCGASCGASCGSSCAGSCAGSCVVSGDLQAGRFDEVVLPAQIELAETIHLEIEAVRAGKTYTKFNR